MSSSTTDALDRLRNPAHTGQNRCLPCTVVNVTLASVGSAALLAVSGPEVAALALLASLVVIYLRGYLVPGTPTLTRRYLPERVLAAFGKVGGADAFESWTRTADLEGEAPGVDVEEFLREEDLVRPEGDDLVLSRPFAAAVDHYVERLDGEVTEADLADAFRTTEERVTPVDRDHPTYTVARRTREWPSEAALALDVALHRALRRQSRGYRSLTGHQRAAVLKSLRGFRDTCPDCGGSVVEDEETVAACCGPGQVLVRRCEDCDQRILEQRS